MQNGQGGRTARLTVLVVEDDGMVRGLLSRVLDAEGMRVLQAANGVAALEIMRRMQTRVALVVTDICMPVMDGLEFARAFQPLYPSIPILFMTGHQPIASERALQEAGARLLHKPFGPEVFVEAVSAMLVEGRPARRSHA
jgi:two-component system cell cycle sensor histidine kinase/response regulator CckA